MAQAFNLTAQLQLQAPGNTSQVMNQIRRQLKPIGVQVNIQNARNIAQANRSLSSFNKNAQASTKSMGQLNRTLQESARRFSVITIATGSFLALANSFKKSVKEAVAFERELVKIAQVTGKSVSQLSSLSNEVTRLSTSLGTSSADLLNVARTLTQAGFAADNTRKALDVLAKTSLGATFDSIQDTTEGAIALLRQFGNEARSVGSDAAFLEKSLSAISAVSKNFAVESGDLITAIRRTGGVFAAAGGEVNELIALFTSVRATTRESAETIATGLRTIFTRIQRPETITQLRDMGVELQDAQGNFVGAFEAFKRLSQGLKGLDPRSSAFSQIVEDLGGFRQVGKVIPLIQQFTTAQRALSVAQGASGTVAKDAETAQQSLGVQIQKTREQFDALIRKFVDSSAFRSLATGGLELAKAFIRIADSLEPLLPMLITLAGLKLGRGLAPALGSFVGIGKSSPGTGPVTKFARGGMVPGTGNRDTVPAMLTPGEFVIRKSSVNKLGAGTLAAMNENRFNKGVRVGIAGQRKDPAFSGSGSVTGVGKIESLSNQIANIPDGPNNETFGGAFLSPQGRVSDLKGQVDKGAILAELQKSKAFQVLSKAKTGTDLKKEFNEIKAEANKKADFQLVSESLSQQKADTIEDIILDGVVSSVNKGSLELSKDTRIKQGGTGEAVRILRQSNIDNVIGNVFEAIIANAGTPYSESKERDGANDPFDFPLGLGSVSKNFGSGRLANIATDAKTRFTSSNITSFIKKVKNSEVNRLGSQILDILDRPDVVSSVNFSKKQIEGEKKGVTPLGQAIAFDKSRAKKRATGGGVSGSDTVPALLTPGEFVFSKGAAQSIGYGNLNRMNKQGVQGYAKGGAVGIQSFAVGGEPKLQPQGGNFGAGIFDPFIDVMAEAEAQVEQNIQTKKEEEQASKKVVEADKRQAINSNKTTQSLQKMQANVQSIDKVAGAAQQFVFIGASIGALFSEFSNASDTTKTAVNRTSAELASLIGIVGTVAQVFTAVAGSGLQKAIDLNQAALAKNTATVNADTAAEARNTAVVNADTATEAANTTAIAADTAAEALNTAAVNADTLAESANTASKAGGALAAFAPLVRGLFNPVTLVIGGLVALVAVISFSKNKIKAENEALAQSAKDLADKFRETGEGLGETRKAILDAVEPTLNKASTPEIEALEEERKILYDRSGARSTAVPDNDELAQRMLLEDPYVFTDAAKAIEEIEKEINNIRAGALSRFAGSLDSSLDSLKSFKDAVKEQDAAYSRISASVFDASTKFEKMSDILEERAGTLSGVDFDLGGSLVAGIAGRFDSISEFESALEDPSDQAEDLRANLYLLKIETDRLAEAQRIAAETVQKSTDLFNKSLGEIQSSEDIDDLSKFLSPVLQQEPGFVGPPERGLAQSTATANNDVEKAFKLMSNAMRQEAEFRILQLEIQKASINDQTEAGKQLIASIDEQIDSTRRSTNANIEANRQYAEEVGRITDIRVSNQAIQSEISARQKNIESMEKLIEVNERLSDLMSRSRDEDTSSISVINRRNTERGLENAIRRNTAALDLQSRGVSGNLVGDVGGLSAERTRLVNQQGSIDKDDKEALNANRQAIKAIDEELNRISTDASGIENFFGAIEDNVRLIEKERAARSQVIGVLEDFVVGGQEARRNLSEAAAGVQAAIATGTIQNQSEDQRRATFGLLDRLKDVVLTFDRATGAPLTGEDVKQRLIFDDAVRLGLDPAIAKELATATSVEEKLIRTNEMLGMQIQMLNLTMLQATQAMSDIAQANPVGSPGAPTQVQNNATGGLVQYRAKGGSIFKPKGTDTVPAMLTPGEFVIRKSAVDKIGVGTLQQINNGGEAVGLARGGIVQYRQYGEGIDPVDYEKWLKENDTADGAFSRQAYKQQADMIAAQFQGEADAYNLIDSSAQRARDRRAKAMQPGGLPNIQEDARTAEFWDRRENPMKYASDEARRTKDMSQADFNAEVQAKGGNPVILGSSTGTKGKRYNPLKERQAQRLQAKRDSLYGPESQKQPEGMSFEKMMQFFMQMMMAQMMGGMRGYAKGGPVYLSTGSVGPLTPLGLDYDPDEYDNNKFYKIAFEQQRDMSLAMLQGEEDANKLIAGSAQRARDRSANNPGGLYGPGYQEKASTTEFWERRSRPDKMTEVGQIPQYAQDKARARRASRIESGFYENANPLKKRQAARLQKKRDSLYGPQAQQQGQTEGMTPEKMMQFFMQMMMMQMMGGMRGYATGGIVQYRQYGEGIDPVDYERWLKENDTADGAFSRQAYKQQADMIAAQFQGEADAYNLIDSSAQRARDRQARGVGQRGMVDLPAPEPRQRKKIDGGTHVGGGLEGLPLDEAKKQAAANARARRASRIESGFYEKANPLKQRQAARLQKKRDSLAQQPQQGQMQGMTPEKMMEFFMQMMMMQMMGGAMRFASGGIVQYRQYGEGIDPVDYEKWLKENDTADGAFSRAAYKQQADMIAAQFQGEADAYDIIDKALGPDYGTRDIVTGTVSRDGNIHTGSGTGLYGSGYVEDQRTKEFWERRNRPDNVGQVLDGNYEIGGTALNFFPSDPTEAELKEKGAVKRTGAAARRRKRLTGKDTYSAAGYSTRSFNVRKDEQEAQKKDDASTGIPRGPVTAKSVIAGTPEPPKPSPDSGAAAGAGVKTLYVPDLDEDRATASPSDKPAGQTQKKKSGFDMNQMMQMMMMMQMMGQMNNQRNMQMMMNGRQRSQMGSGFLNFLGGRGQQRGGRGNNMVPFGYIPGSPYNSTLGGGIYNIPMFDKRLMFGAGAAFFASGGGVGGDTVPAMLTPGEFVMNKNAVSKYGTGFMRNLNKGKIQGFNKGGPVQYRQNGGGVAGMAGAAQMVDIDTSKIEGVFSSFVDNISSTFDNLVSPLNGVVQSLNQIAQSFGNFTMDHKVSVDGLISLGGLNIESIKSELSTTIGQMVSEEVTKTLNKNNNDFKSA